MRPLRTVLCLVVTAWWATTAPGAAAEALPWLVPPVDGGIERRFEPPESAYGPGHRGIDLHARPGTAVRAAASGTVAFAGRVGDSVAVTIRHPGNVETTYSVLSEVFVKTGDRVSEGSWIGRAESAHPGGAGGLHFGVKLEGAYVDPETLMGPLDATRAIHLAPLPWSPPAVMGDEFTDAFRVHDFEPGCRSGGDLARAPDAPNENVAVAVAGIGSSSDDAEIYEHGPEELGYPPDRVYRFSYRGHQTRDLHEPYESSDTWNDIRAAALKLRALMGEIGRRHPGAAVDLIAHSQGGIVARAYLAGLAGEWDPHLPQVRHLVTFSSPHDGAPLADLVEELPARTLTGGRIVRGLSEWARSGGPIPDPLSVSVSQLRPGSGLLADLAAEDLSFGTRALALAIPNDVVVPADRAGLPEDVTRAVPPSGVNGHDAIVSSGRARALAHAFLRDAADPCASGWDVWAPRAGWLVERAERRIPDALARLEREAIKRVIRLLLP